MATYAIGDLQGCYEPLQRLLRHIGFDPGRDRLLFAGDLVNRGPESLQCLRFIQSLGAAATAVLGNHDLHLLAVAQGGPTKSRDSFEDILAAPDRDVLLAWLQDQPLAWQDPVSGALLVHAGVVPQWTAAQTLALAAEASLNIRQQGAAFYERMYGDQPDLWDDRLQGVDRIRFIVNCLTRLRYCDVRGRMNLRPKGAPGTQPAGLMPWFEVPGRASAGVPMICGHWSTLGRVHWPQQQVWGLDTGCVWGGALTALKLETGELIQEGCSQYHRPGQQPSD